MFFVTSGPVITNKLLFKLQVINAGTAVSSRVQAQKSKTMADMFTVDVFDRYFRGYRSHTGNWE